MPDALQLVIVDGHADQAAAWTEAESLSFDSKYVIVPWSGCWIWMAYVTPAGYGRFTRARSTQKRGSSLAHRANYERFNGPIPKGLELDHLCRVPCCVNPLHLEPVTRLEHSHRDLRYNPTFCWRGHAYTLENTYLGRKSGWRACRECARMAEKLRPPRPYVRKIPYVRKKPKPYKAREK